MGRHLLSPGGTTKRFSSNAKRWAFHQRVRCRGSKSVNWNFIRHTCRKPCTRRRKRCNGRRIPQLRVERWEGFCKHLARERKPCRNLRLRKRWYPKSTGRRKESP